MHGARRAVVNSLPAWMDAGEQLPRENQNQRDKWACRTTQHSYITIFDETTVSFLSKAKSFRVLVESEQNLEGACAIGVGCANDQRAIRRLQCATMKDCQAVESSVQGVLMHPTNHLIKFSQQCEHH